ncbi:MAG: hypothetical protein E7271_00730 [Lachnospiraceae bacterium]|nr:hypothetical protein [Lachnospiraceae bacterium]
MKKMRSIIYTFIATLFLVIISSSVSFAANANYKTQNVPCLGAYSVLDGYYIVNEKLYHTDATGETEELVSVAGESYLTKSVSAVYAGNVYITGSGDMYIDGNETLKTYVYNIAERRIISTYNCALINVTDGYAVSQDKYDSGMNPYPVSIYKLTSNGMKKVKTLTKRSRYVKMIGKGKNKRILYSYYPKKLSMSQMNIYSVKVNGKGKKKLATLKQKDPSYSGIILNYANTKYCKVFNGGFYKYVYKDKKYIKLN